MKIIKEIKINGEWINQDLVPKETAAKLVEETLNRAVKTIGFKPKKEEQA